MLRKDNLMGVSLEMQFNTYLKKKRKNEIIFFDKLVTDKLSHFPLKFKNNV